MFERFTDPARRVLVLAQEEARALGHATIGPEHLLLGLLVDNEGEASHALPSHVSPAAVRARVEALTGREEQPAAAGQIPFAPPAKEALEAAVHEADGLGHEHVGTGHLLLGLLREGDGRACQVLEALGADVDAVRERAVALAGGEAPTSGLRSWSGLEPMSQRVVRARARAQAERDPVRENDPAGWEILDCAATAVLRALSAARRHAADALREQIAPIDLVVGVLAVGDTAVRDALAEAGADDPSPARITPGYREDPSGDDGDDPGQDNAVVVLSVDARRACSMAARLVTEEDRCIKPAHLLLAALEALGPVRAAAVAERLGAHEAALHPALLRRTVRPPDESARDPLGT